VNNEWTLNTLGSGIVDDWPRIVTMPEETLTFQYNPLAGVLLAMRCEPR
jgi:hypothetical protein